MPGIKRKFETSSRNNKKVKVAKAPPKRSAKPESDDLDETDTTEEDVDTSASENSDTDGDVEMKDAEEDTKPKRAAHSADGQKPSTLANLNCMRCANHVLS